MSEESSAAENLDLSDCSFSDMEATIPAHETPAGVKRSRKAKDIGSDASLKKGENAEKVKKAALKSQKVEDSSSPSSEEEDEQSIDEFSTDDDLPLDDSSADDDSEDSAVDSSEED